MYGAKPDASFQTQTPWPWTNPSYTLRVSFQLEDIDSITIDPEQRSCDVVTRNNEWVTEE
jgi:hypothetical protein